MPLIDSIMELTVKGRKDKHLIIDEKEGTRYRFDAGRENYIENEILQIRVTGIEKNPLIGQNDQLLGVVVSSELDPGKILEKHIEIVETGKWEPTKQYGPTAARELYPQHAGEVFRKLTFSFGGNLEPEDIENINNASNMLQQGNHDEAVEILGSALGKYPWLLDLYHVMGVIAASHQDFDLARKYFLMGCKTAELSLPEDDCFVLDHREPANSFYQSLLHSLADLLIQTGKNEEALDYYERCYMLTPQDPAGVRVILQKLTGNEYPCTDERVAGLPVDPYHYYFKYNDMPISDGYDPDTRPDYEKWLKWEDSYRRLLILLAHQEIFIQNKVKPESVDIHISVHDLAESSLAQNQPEGIRMTLARNLADGHSRHEIIHLIGDRLLKSMAKAQEQMKNQNKAAAK